MHNLAEKEEITVENLLPVLITAVIRDENLRLKILEDLRTPTFDDTVKLIEQRTFNKNTNARIEKRRQDSNVAALSTKNSETICQMDKSNRLMEKPPKKGK